MPIVIILLSVFIWNNFIKKEEKGFFEKGFDFISSLGSDLIKKIETQIQGINNSFDDIFTRVGIQEGINPKVLKAVAMNESWLGKYRGLEPIGGTSGLMHIKLSTAQDFMPSLTHYELYESSDSDENQVRAAAKYIKHLNKLFKGDDEKIVMSYNQGEGNTIKGKTYAAEYWTRFNRNLERLG